MGKLRIKSTYPPVIFTKPSGRKYLAGGTITEVNGRPWSKAYVGVKPWVTLDNITWVAPVAPKPVKPLTKKVQGSSGKVYILERQPNGKWSCTCPGYQYRRFCKHTGAK